MKWKLLLILLFVLSGDVAVAARSFKGGQEVRKSWYERIISTHPGEDWARLRQNFESWRRLVHGCQSQLRRGHLPFACYELIRRELDWQILSRVEYREAALSLDKICASRAESIADLERLKIGLGHPNLPKTCRESLARRFDVLLYRWRKDHPERVFHSRNRL